MAAAGQVVLFERRTAEPLLRHVVGGILRAERTEQARTLLDVALAAQVSTAYLSEVERAADRGEHLRGRLLAAALGLRVVDLLARSQDEFDAEANRRAGVERRSLTSRPRAARDLHALGPAPARTASSRQSVSTTTVLLLAA